MEQFKKPNEEKIKKRMIEEDYLRMID